MIPRQRFSLLGIVLGVGLLISLACGASPSNPPIDQMALHTQLAHTLIVQMIQTQAYWTVAAQLTTLAPTLTPTPSSTETPPPLSNTPTLTNTPTPTNTPLVSPTATASQTPPATQTLTATPIPCNWVKFIADVTVPDGTAFEPGQSFTKVWRLQNAGTCAWTQAYQIVFVGGNQMGAGAVAQLPAAVAPGQTIDIGINMVAPTTAGSYQGNWKLRSPDGQVFGLGTGAALPFWVKITVNSPCDWAQFVGDLTVPDGIYYPPDVPFTKMWWIKNIGRCTWTTSYALVFAGGDQLGAPNEVPLTATVLPGQTVAMSVNMRTPNRAGTFTGYWKLRNASGKVFGVGPNADTAFWVRFNVAFTATLPPSVTPSPTLTFTPTASVTPTTPSP